MKVLIIEDDPQILEAVTLTFQIRWPEVELVSSQLGERGIEMVETERPDIVILDLGLPDMSGYDVLKQIRLFSDVTILILTVRAEEVDVIKGLEWGADGRLYVMVTEGFNDSNSLKVAGGWPRVQIVRMNYNAATHTLSPDRIVVDSLTVPGPTW